MPPTKFQPHRDIKTEELFFVLNFGHINQFAIIHRLCTYGTVAGHVVEARPHGSQIPVPVC